MQGGQSVDQFYGEEESQGINFREYLLVIRKRLPIVVAIAVVVFAWKMVDTYSKVPIYTASADVLIEKSASTSGLEYQYLGYDPYFLTTQTQIIRSENVARRVVEILQLDTRYKQYFISTAPKKKSFIAGVKGQVRSIVRLFVPAGEKSKSDKSENGLETTPTKDTSLARPVNSDAEIIAAMIRGKLSVSPVPETKIVTITYKDKNPFIAKLVANAVVQAYKDVTLDIKLSSSNYTLQWMTQKAEEEKNKLESAEQALQQYMRANDLVTVEDRLALLPQKLSQISSDYTKAQSERKEVEAVYSQIIAASGNISALENIPIFATNEVLQNIREKIFRAKQALKDLSKKYGPKHPVMIKANDDLEILYNERKFELDRIIASTKNSFELAKSREENLRERLGTTKTDLLNMNEKFVQYSIMKRDVDTTKVLYDALTANIKKASVTEQAQSVNIWVVREADMPGYPSYPNKKRELMLGLVMGLVLGGGLAFVLEFLDNTIKSEKDLTTKFNLTVLGTIEQVKGSKNEIENFILRQPLSPLAESYRLVRSNLLLSSADHPPRTILITSMGPKEGKTSTTVNIARVLSQDDKKVVIIDCDLRKPRMHSLFSMDNKVGLSNYLTGNMEGNILFDVPGEDVKLIPSGLIPPNPAELLNSKKMKILVRKMSEMFDFVLLDSPPIQRVTDSLAVSQIVDGTIVVVRARKTTFDMLNSGLKKLKAGNTHFLGFVLNGMSRTEAGSGYYAGYNTYYAKDTD